MKTKAEYSMRYLIAFVWVALLSSAASANQGPPAEFWDYMIEFGDEQANVIDPADYALMLNLPGRDTRQNDENISEEPAPQRTNTGDAVEKAP
jgi:hypothetical protein